MTQYITLNKNKEGTRLYINTINFTEKQRKEFYKLLVELGFTIIHMELDIEAFLEDNNREKAKWVMGEISEFCGFSWNENEISLRISITKHKSFREIKKRILKNMEIKS